MYKDRIIFDCAQIFRRCTDIQEIISLTTDDSQYLEIRASQSKEEIHAFYEQVLDCSQRLIFWESPLAETEEASFMWLCRKLIRKLRSGGILKIFFDEQQDLSRLFSFPRDRLRAIVNPILNEYSRYAVELVGVHYGGLAERAGLTIGDTIVEWNGLPLNHTYRPWKYFYFTENNEIHLLCRRDGELFEVTVPCAKPLSNAEVIERIGRAFGLQQEGEVFRRVLPVSSDESLVSVLLHAYKPRWFAEALQSVLDQTYQNLEIIIEDDNRQGEIKAIVDELVGNDPRVRYFLNGPPFRAWGAGNRYFCFQRATG